MAATVGYGSVLDGRDEIETALHQLSRRVRILRSMPSSREVGAGDEHAGLAAAEDQAAQVAACLRAVSTIASSSPSMAWPSVLARLPG